MIKEAFESKPVDAFCPMIAHEQLLNADARIYSGTRFERVKMMRLLIRSCTTSVSLKFRRSLSRPNVAELTRKSTVRALIRDLRVAHIRPVALDAICSSLDETRRGHISRHVEQQSNRVKKRVPVLFDDDSQI